jgi:hypothetical protein
VLFGKKIITSLNADSRHIMAFFLFNYPNCRNAK